MKKKVQIIDFNDEPNDEVIIVSPRFRINDNNVEISVKNDVFTVKVGCRSAQIDSKNVDMAIAELGGQVHERASIKVIHLKKKKAKTTDPILQAKTAKWLISASNKAYPTGKYSTSPVLKKVPQKFFSANTDNWRKQERPMCFKGYGITKKDIEKVGKILGKCKAYFASVETQ